MSLTGRVLAGLVAGLVVGAVVAAVRTPVLLTGVSIVEPLGTLWVNAIRMTVIPMVVALLIAGIASAPGAGAVGRVGLRVTLLFALLLAASALLAVIVAPPLLSLLPVDPAAAVALRERATAAAGSLPSGTGSGAPSIRAWVVGLVPVNPVAAAAEGRMLPLIVFSLIFSLGALRLGNEKRGLLVRFSEAVADTMLVVVRWILAAAPVGVFALALPLTLQLGLGAAGALVYYVILVAGLCTLYSLALYPVASVFGGMSVRAFSRAAAPAQGIAVSSRSSLASLPPMIEESERLRLPETTTGFVLPLAVSLFRASAPVGSAVGVLFLARLYGVELGGPELATVATLAAVLSLSIPGIPGGSILVMAPILLAAGVPLDGMGILLAVDTIPDMFRTGTNVTADMAVATIVGRAGASPRPPDPETVPEP